MNITINIKETNPKVTIIKDEKAELEQFNLLVDGIIKRVMDNPEQGEKQERLEKIS